VRSDGQVVLVHVLLLGGLGRRWNILVHVVEEKGGVVDDWVWRQLGCRGRGHRCRCDIGRQSLCLQRGGGVGAGRFPRLGKVCEVVDAGDFARW
jgi:hypothetical protein